MELISPASDSSTSEDVVVLRGRVVSGIGDMSRWVRWNADVYARATGARLYPGSLNVLLDRPWRMNDPLVRLEPDDYDVGGVGMNIAPCELEGIPAFIFRTDANNSEGGTHSLKVIEVAAEVRLRDALGVVDGDEVSLVVARHVGS